VSESPHTADVELVERMLAGEEDAFETFADRCFKPLYRFASARLQGDRELTREIVQTAVTKALAKLGTYRGEASLLTWLCACCRNEIAAHFRRLNRRPREVELDEAIVREEPGGSETAELVHAALDRLPPGYARAMEWRYLDGLEVAEVAQRLELSYKAAESLLSRARRAFREAYEALTANPDTAQLARTVPEKEVVR
jgi:RNA polymerase sigma-70 factor (ECF subfamily)